MYSFFAYLGQTATTIKSTFATSLAKIIIVNLSCCVPRWKIKVTLNKTPQLALSDDFSSALSENQKKGSRVFGDVIKYRTFFKISLPTQGLEFEFTTQEPRPASEEGPEGVDATMRQECGWHLTT